MRKYLLLLLVLFSCALLPAAAHSAGSGSSRKLTLMIYMCGSNLESGYGAASADIDEMKAAGVDGKEVSVLIMTGGAEHWAQGFDASTCLIHELRPRGTRIVWQSEALNMGDPDTLSALLRFGRENRPADQYALILWNHGGGPMEGICWDELFSLDRLSLQELTDAIRGGMPATKLEWIGFDACLMSSVEVASALAPRAKYMIASQETEPEQGWDYSFLSRLGGCANGAEAGRLIADSYIDSLAGSQEILTIACVDLTKIGRVTKQMDAFFSPVATALDETAFDRLSSLRMHSASFGKAVRGVESSSAGYDLVDLADLVSRFEGDPEPLLEALREAVVYTRSSEPGPNGLSVYHPYSNKEKYLESWHDNYLRLYFCPGYTQYITQFGVLLTGESLTEWTGLPVPDRETAPDSLQVFSLQLAPEQQEHFLSAKLLILESTEGMGWDEQTYAPVAEEEATLDENGILSASWRGRSLYVVDADGNVLQGPISYIQTDDSDTLVILAEYEDYSTRPDHKEDIVVQHFCAPDEKTGDMQIVRSRVWDPVSRSYTNRIGFSRDGYTQIAFFNFLHNLPSGPDPLPSFFDWPSFDGYTAKGTTLPADWRLCMLDNAGHSFLYAAFQITDLQQNVYSTPLVPVENPKESPLSFSRESFDTGTGSLQLSGFLQETRGGTGFTLILLAENTTERNLYYSTDYVILNNRRMLPLRNGLDVPAGECRKIILSVSGDDLLDLTSVSRIEISLRIREKDHTSEEAQQFFLHTEVMEGGLFPLPAASPSSLAAGESEGVRWELKSFSRDQVGNLAGLLYVYNDTDSALSGQLVAAADGMTDNAGFSVLLESHTDGFFRFRINRWQSLSASSFRHGSGLETIMNMDRFAEKSDAVERVELFPWQFSDLGAQEPGSPISFRLPEPLLLRTDCTEQSPLPSLLEGDVSVRTEGACIHGQEVALSLRFRNDTDETASLMPDDVFLNGFSCSRPHFSSPVVLPAHTESVGYLIFDKSDLKDPAEVTDDGSPELLEFRWLLDYSRLSETAAVRFPADAVSGESDYACLRADTLEIAPAQFIAKEPLFTDHPRFLFPEKVHPVELTAPLTPEEEAAVESVRVTVCLLGNASREEEDGTQKEYLTALCIQSAPMERQASGRFTAVLSGLAVRVGDCILQTSEHRPENGQWELTSDGALYFYEAASEYRPSDFGPYGIYFSDGWTVGCDLHFTIYQAQDGVTLTGSRVEYYHSLSDLNPAPRIAYDLCEMEAAVVETQTFFGANRSIRDAFRRDQFPLSLDGSISPELLPLEQLEGRLGLYYSVTYTDGTRGDRIVDWETGEILDTW